MLDPTFKNICLVLSFIGHEQGVSIVKECDKTFSFPMFLKFHHHSYPMVKYKVVLLTKKIMRIVVYIFID
jgi:hypothetical protein